MTDEAIEQGLPNGEHDWNRGDEPPPRRCTLVRRHGTGGRFEAAFDQQKTNIGTTEYVEMPDRGHALTIDHGWRYVAETALAFICRFV